MNMRTVNNNHLHGESPGGNALLVDKFIGNAYDTVRFVALNMSFIKHVSFHLKEVYDVAHHMDELVRVAADLGNIDIVAEIADDVVTLAAQAQGLIDLAAKLQELMTIHDNLPALLDLEANTPALVDLHSHQAEILAVYAQLPDIAALVPKLNEIGAVYTNLAQVVAVGDNIASVKNVSDNMERILNVEAELALINQVANQVDELIAQIAAVETGIYAKFAAPDGLKNVGQVATWAALATTVPTAAGQRVFLKEYAAGTGRGGGILVAVNAAGTEDGGYRASVNANWHWRREISTDEMNVVHFGAVMNGTTDDMPSVLRMHNWSRSIDTTFGPGIKVPAGSIALSSLDLGTAEIPAFKFKGPDVEFGVAPKLRIIPLSATTTVPMFKFCARRTEISGFAAIGTGTVQPWFINTVTRGSYVRIKSIVSRGTGGRMFQFIDTIDCKIDQIYSYSSKAGIIWVTWSNENPGVWDHPTAIELTNANFSSQTGEFAFSAIRCGQSIMRNVWFTSCERGFDVSQGGWVFDTVIAEGPSAGGLNYAGQAKIVEFACRFAQGATVGRNPEDSGYDPAMDVGPINNGNKPNWVTNAMDQGRVIIDTTIVSQQNGLSRGFDLPLITQRFLNNTGQEKWIYIGKVVNNATQGATFEMDLQGANGYDSIPSSLNHPGSTGFGGGRALIRGQLKQNVESTTSLQLSWHGEGACPIKEVRYVHAWQSFDIYVRVGAFNRVLSMQLRGDGVGRDRSGSPFYFRAGSGDPVDISAVANLRVAKKNWAINGGTASDDGGFGFGMDLDNGQIVMASPEVGTAAALFLNVRNRYVQRYIPIQDTMQSIRVPRYTTAALPRADANPFGLVLVTDSGAGSGAASKMQFAFSDGEKWLKIAVDGDLGIGSSS